MPFNPKFFKKLFDHSDDRALLAAVKSSDNPTLRFRVYPELAKCGIALNEHSALPYIVLGASIARLGLKADGTLSLGQALRLCFKEQGPDDPGVQSRLRRVLACDSAKELCQILPSLLKLIESRLEGAALSYSELYNLIILFDLSLDRARAKLVQQFYGFDTDSKTEEQGASA